MVDVFQEPPSQPGPVTPSPTPPVVVVEYKPGPNDVQLLPDGTWGFPNFVYTPRPLLNSLSRPRQTKTRQVSIIAEGQPIKITVGRDSIGGDIVDLWTGAGHLFVVVGWGHGPYEEIEEVWIGDQLYTGDRNDYLGANTEELDPYIAGEHPSYTFNPIDRVFSVLRIHPSFEFQSLNPRAVVKGRNDIWDPRLNGGSGGFAYTENAALIRGWLRSKFMGDTVDDADLTICANFSDDLLQSPLDGDETQDRGKFRHHIGLTFDRFQSKYRWDALLGEISQTFIAHEGDTVHMIPNRDDAAVATIGPADMIAGSDWHEKLRPSKTPNVETVVYTQIVEGEPWRDAYFSTPFPASGPTREAETRMPAFQHLATAQRWAKMRIAFNNTTSYIGGYKTRDEGLRRLIGNIVNYSDTQGLGAIKVRLLNVYPTGKGEWTFEWQEHDPDAYVEDYVPAPDTDPVFLPNPNDIPDGPIPTITENVYQDELGFGYSRLKITWPGIDWPFTGGYRCKVTSGAEVIINQQIPSLGEGVTHEAITGPVTQGVQYKAEVWNINIFGSIGETSGVAFYIAQGELLRPPPPASFTILEAGGVVYFSWENGFDLDLRGSEIRYGSIGTPWEDMQVVNRWGVSVAGESNTIPVGTWDFEIRHFDSIHTQAEPFGQYSLSGLRRRATVDSDANSFHVSTTGLVYDDVASENLIEIHGTYWTDAGESWLDVFGTSPMSNFTSPVSVHQSDIASKWVSESIDIGQVLTLNIIAEHFAENVDSVLGFAALEDIDGEPITLVAGGELQTTEEIEFETTINLVIETRVDAIDPWTRHTESSILVSARYVRVSIECPATSRMKVPPTYGTLELNVIAHETRGDFTTDGLGPTTINVGRAVAKFTFVAATAIGTDVFAVVEDVRTGDPGEFDVYVLDSGSNSQVVGSGFWNANYY